MVLGISSSILTLLYWYTRTTTAGLSISGTLASALGTITEQISSLFYASRDEKVEWSVLVLMIIVTTLMVLPAILMIRLSLPFEISKNGKKGWGIRRWTWSHRERASRRIGDQVPWSFRGCVR